MKLEKGDKITINARNGQVVITVDNDGDVWVLTDAKIIKKPLP